MTEEHVHVDSGGGCVGCLLAILLLVVISMLLGWMDPPAWLLGLGK